MPLLATTTASGDGHDLSSRFWHHTRADSGKPNSAAKVSAAATLSPIVLSKETTALRAPLSEQVLEGLEFTPKGWHGQRAQAGSGKPNSAAKASAAATLSPIFSSKEAKAFRTLGGGPLSRRLRGGGRRSNMSAMHVARENIT